ncbi:hypothetical protein D9758_007266 [Tetrapyrgos nigripes]|uniref:Uncharacterized protein n=1 Tax=Tetrapyrgos nigripes TaxID=182062 RepID=A0A8H5D0V6_9AGAR|nr:hypothetical protein D9758_007266 [Tetrapyrgos nigripes]
MNGSYHHAYGHIPYPYYPPSTPASTLNLDPRAQNEPTAFHAAVPSTPQHSNQPVQYGYYIAHSHVPAWVQAPQTPYTPTTTLHPSGFPHLQTPTPLIQSTAQNKRQTRKCNADSNTDQPTHNVCPCTTQKENDSRGVTSITASVTGAEPISGSAALDSNIFSIELNHPALDSNIFKSVKAKHKNPKATATDVWWFITPTDNDTVPVIDKTTLHQIHKVRPRLKEGKDIACRFCQVGSKHGIWKNLENSSLTKNIRNHLLQNHHQEYHEFILKFQLKGWETLRPSADSHPLPSYACKPSEPLNREQFWHLLVRWIVADDQSMNVVECQEFRDLLEYIGLDLKSQDIPHHKKLTELIFEQFENCFKNTQDKMKCSLGCISYTSDMWSNGVLQGFMAITAHYMIYEHRHLVMRSQLIAFRYVDGSHDGPNMAKAFFQILKEYSIEHRIGMITLDNASNNDTMMCTFKGLFKEIGVEFSCSGNRVHCFPHVVNIAVKTGLSKLNTVVEFDDADGVDKSEIWDSQIVTASRASHKRQEGLWQTIISARSKARDMLQAKGVPEKDLPSLESIQRVVVLLRDVDTCWSSIYFMIDRLLELYIIDLELQLLSDIRMVLQAFHVSQQLVSMQKTPTLSAALPAYEGMLSNLKTLNTMFPYLSHMISASILKIQEYVDKARSTHMYAFAMFINPISKTTWIERQ